VIATIILPCSERPKSPDLPSLLDFTRRVFLVGKLCGQEVGRAGPQTRCTCCRLALEPRPLPPTLGATTFAMMPKIFTVYSSTKALGCEGYTLFASNCGGAILHQGATPESRAVAARCYVDLADSTFRKACIC
jgi:hypothetical protein